jgi:class 3 adenylate cyclase
MARSRVPLSNASERKLVMLVVDLAGTTRLVSRFDAVELAELINTFFAACGDGVTAHGGRIVTFLGDGCLAVFPEKEGLSAIDAADDIRTSLGGIGKEFGVTLEMGANIHQAVVAEGEYAPDGHYNVMGTGVVHTFRMGAGPGTRISEPVYRQLPNERRGAWQKQQPPATYTFQPDGQGRGTR